MFHALTTSLQTVLVERLTLLMNHVLGAEPVALERLRAHQNRHMLLQLDAWPSLLPALPPLAFRVTAAGLLEWCSDATSTEADLCLRVDASNPARTALRWAGGERPRVDVQGDAQFATDLAWLAEHLRWDVHDDLSRLVGPASAHEIERVGRALAAGLRDAAAVLAGGGGAAGGPGRAAR